MNPFEVTSTLTLADWQAYQAAWALRMQSRSRLSRRALLGVAAAALVLASLIVLIAVRLQQPVPFLAVVIGACAAVLGIMINMRRIRAASQPDEHGVVLGPSYIRFDADGIHMDKPHSRVLHQWAVLQEVTQGPEHLFIWIDRVVALIIPLRDLPPHLTPPQAIEQIRALASSGREQQAPLNFVREEYPAAAPAREQDQTSGSGYLRSIGRFLMLRPATLPSLAPGDRSLALAGVLLIGGWILLDRALAEPGSIFYIYGMLGVGWYAGLVVLTAGLWSRLSQPVLPLRTTLGLALAFVPVAVLLVLLILEYVPTSGVIGALILVAFYAVGYGHTGLRSLTSRHQPQAVFASLLTLSLAAWFAYAQYVTPQFWYPDEEAAAEESDAHDYQAQWRQTESLLFGQADRIDALIAAFERPDSLSAAGFFVGFAGMGEERVFAGEISLASDVIAQKYGTAPRSIELVNDRRDLAAYPFANPSSLRRALSGVAGRMDVDRDVLFLALASHGSEDGQLSVSNLGMPMNDLSVQELADALDQSGIRWRVVIVSACYSGQFIEPLRDDYTIVIAASAPDRTSFGCADDRDLTYFGEAFYRDALPTSPDLRTAFQKMKTAIERRETEEGVEPSRPQAHFGAALERHLQSLTH